MADQRAAGAVAAFGHKLVKTPYLNRLAARGTVFENAYGNNPICASSRFAMMSGPWSSEIGAFDNAAELVDLARKSPGKLKAIAVTSNNRLDDLPSVPTLAESGFADVVGGSGWFGIVAPVGTPAAVVNRFNQESIAALKSPEVIERLRRAYAFAGVRPARSTA